MVQPSLDRRNDIMSAWGMAHPIDQLIDERGGNAVFAESIGAAANTVAQWRLRRRVPRTAWPEIMQVHKDVDLRLLREIEDAPSDRAEPQNEAA